MFTSKLVLYEAAQGNPNEATKRLTLLESVQLIEVSEAAVFLATALVMSNAIPAKAAGDALHLAIAAVNGIDFLVTWNCKHLANAQTRRKLEFVCESAGYSPVVICTPEELIEED